MSLNFLNEVIKKLMSSNESPIYLRHMEVVKKYSDIDMNGFPSVKSTKDDLEVPAEQTVLP